MKNILIAILSLTLISCTYQTDYCISKNQYELLVRDNNDVDKIIHVNITEYNINNEEQKQYKDINCKSDKTYIFNAKCNTKYIKVDIMTINKEKKSFIVSLLNDYTDVFIIDENLVIF